MGNSAPIFSVNISKQEDPESVFWGSTLGKGSRSWAFGEKERERKREKERRKERKKEKVRKGKREREKENGERKGRKKREKRNKKGMGRRRKAEEVLMVHNAPFLGKQLSFLTKMELPTRIQQPESPLRRLERSLL